ncbi:MAG: hypothetical protein AAGF12_34355 [Myxococcota bacterium]
MKKTFLILGLGAVLGGAVALLVQPAPTGAQSPSGGNIAAGPGGMWVLRGNRVSVCVGGLIADGNRPPAPICGPSTPVQ